MIGNILDNTTELYMIKYAFGEIFSAGGATLCKNPSDQAVILINVLDFLFFKVDELIEKKNLYKIREN